MKIRNISCEQFAGVREQSVSFEDGINVIYGKNESGKSTLVNLLSRTLFQSARLDGRSDKDFIDLYFPSARKGSIAGDSVDGKVSFETESGVYTLSKVWGADSGCILSTPDGMKIRNQATIDGILKETLLYGEGVYSEMLFSSQKNSDMALQTILDASKKSDAKQEIADAVSKAFAESDGVSIDAIEQAINAKIDEIAGKHWDFERDMPMRKTGRWANGLGEILKAYYALEDAKSVLDEISRLEAEASRASEEYNKKDNATKTAEDEYAKFNAFAGRLAVQSERRKTVERLKNEQLKIAEVLVDWPVLAEKLEKAKCLQNEKLNREIIDKYEAAKAIADELKELETGVDKKLCPDDSEIMKVRVAQRDVTSLENKLCGMNLSAAIKLFDGNTLEITSLRTGESVDISNGAAAITEAVKIAVPGVMEMQLLPANVDADAIEAQIAEQKQIISAIFGKYGVDSVDELEDLARKITDAKAKADVANNRLKMILGASTFEEVETAAKAIAGAVRGKEEVDRDIIVLCGSGDVSRFITAKETIMEGYIREHGSVTDLKAKAFDLEEELKKAKESISSEQDIPAEFLKISDPDAHLNSLQEALKLARSYRETALTSKTAAVSKLEGYRENISVDPEESVQRAEQIFNEQKSLLSHWLHIAEVFKKQKENVSDNPMQDIVDGFKNYLSVISCGKVSSEFPEADKLNMNIYSDKRPVDYGKLSEGTKDTVSLAFRLAVLDHLFPEGGGVIVFDDPFTDMDAERTAQACELLRDCATRHQVIFLTCKEEYLATLGGNSISFRCAD